MTALRTPGLIRRRRADAGAATASRGAEVSVRHVVKRYGEIEALQDVSVEVGSGEWITVTGPSGSGKSTLLNLIGSLDRPDAGTILVRGEPVPEPRDAVHFRRLLVGFVFQDNMLLPYLTAQSNIETALLAAGAERRQRRQRSLELLAEVGLSERARHLPSELSAGERQRVALARALANQPRLLLADEPTGALDSANSERVLDLLGATRERHGTTVIVVSHAELVADRADRVVHLVEGRVHPS